MDMHDDNRLELIERYKKQLVESTNIKSSPDEMAVIDSILFRFWQMGWLKEQEPVLLKNQHKPYGHFINANSPWISRCPRCGKKVEGKQTRFCKYCGQAVKWDD